MRLLCITTVLFVVLTACYSRVPLYHCDFDNNISDDCLSKRTLGASALIRTIGLFPDETPVQSLPNDLSVRTYAFVKTPNAGAFDQTYSIEVKTGESSVQCIDFDYYITNTSDNAKINVLWEDGSTKQQIVEVKASSNNQWQHSQRTYHSPSSNNYQISFQLTRIEGPATFYYGLDNIYIFDGPCGSLNNDESQLSASNSMARFNMDDSSTDTSELPTSSAIDAAATTTDASTIAEATTIHASTTAEAATTDTSTIAEATTSDASTTVQATTTDASTTAEATTSDASTTVQATTTDASTTAEATTSDASTTVQATTTDASTTVQATTTDASTTAEATTSDASTTVQATTTDASTTAEATISDASTTIEATTTDASTTAEATTSDAGTTAEATTIDASTAAATTIHTGTTSLVPIDISITTTEPSATSAETTSTTIDGSAATTEGSTTSTTVTSITNEASTTVATSSEVTTASPTNSIITTGTSTSTTLSPLIPLLECSFSEISCLSDGEDFVTISNGSQFSDAIRLNSSEPPRGPVSSATSIPTATSDGESCDLPYNVSPFISNTSTNWNMWFCYENTCPTSDGRVLNCSSGEYALIPFEPVDTSKNISLTIQRRSRIVAEPREQCLRYYYYITAYKDTSDRNQTIEIYIKTDNQTSDFEPINIITLENIIENDWQDSSVTFNSSTDNYTLTFVFKADPFNPTDSAMNRPINFALDEIKVYDASCSYLDQYLLSTTGPSPFPTSTSSGTPLTTTTQTPSSPPPTTTTTQTPPPTGTTSSTTVAPSVVAGPNLGLILGLSLGLGIPALLGIIGGVVYYCKKDQRKKNTYLTKRTGVSTSKKAGYEQYQGDDDVTNTFF